jgi:hypothetical protein
MNWADKRIMYLGAVIFVLGAVVQFLVTYNGEMGEPFAPFLGIIPPALFGPILFGIGGALFITSRRAIKAGESNSDSGRPTAR